MHSSGNKTLKQKFINLFCAAKNVVAANVGRPAVITPNPKSPLRTNNPVIKDREIGMDKNVPNNGSIKFIPEKNNLCEPSIKLNLKNDNKDVTESNTAEKNTFFKNLLMIAFHVNSVT